MLLSHVLIVNNPPLLSNICHLSYKSLPRLKFESIVGCISLNSMWSIHLEFEVGGGWGGGGVRYIDTYYYFLCPNGPCSVHLAVYTSLMQQYDYELYALQLIKRLEMRLSFLMWDNNPHHIEHVIVWCLTKSGRDGCF